MQKKLLLHRFLKQLLVSLLLSSIPLFAQSRESEKPKSPRHKLLIAIPQMVKPMAWMDKDNQVKGPYTEVLKEAMRRSHLDFEIVSDRPFKRSLKQVERGDLDAIFPMFKSQERSNLFLFPQKALGQGTMAFFRLKGTKMQFDGDFTKLSGWKIGSLRGSTPGLGSDEFEAAIKNGTVKIEEFNDFEKGMQMLRSNRFDVICGNKSIISVAAEETNTPIEQLSRPIAKTNFYLMFSRNYDYSKVIEKLNAALTAMESDGTHQRIFSSEKY